MKKRLFALMLTGVLGFSMCACGGKETVQSTNPEDFEPVVLKFANQHPDDSTATASDRRICERIEEATEGRVKVELYTNSSMGDYVSVFDELMLGTIDMAHISAVETYGARITASMLPYLGSNYDELRIAYHPDNFLYQTVFEYAQKLGLRTFGFYCEGFSGVGCMGELTNASEPGKDKNAIVRIAGLDNFALVTRDMGFRTATIAYSDTYTAIQTGTVNGWQGGPPNLNYLYFRDVIDHYYHYMMTQEATQIFMNEKRFQSLLPQDQEAITQIIQEECAASFDLAEQDDQKYMQLMEDMGITIVEFTDEERAIMAESCRTNVWPQLAKNTSEEFLNSILESLEWTPETDTTGEEADMQSVES